MDQQKQENFLARLDRKAEEFCRQIMTTIRPFLVSQNKPGEIETLACAAVLRPLSTRLLKRKQCLSLVDFEQEYKQTFLAWSLHILNYLLAFEQTSTAHQQIVEDAHKSYAATFKRFRAAKNARKKNDPEDDDPSDKDEEPPEQEVGDNAADELPEKEAGDKEAGGPPEKEMVGSLGKEAGGSSRNAAAVEEDDDDAEIRRAFEENKRERPSQSARKDREHKIATGHVLTPAKNDDNHQPARKAREQRTAADPPNAGEPKSALETGDEEDGESIFFKMWQKAKSREASQQPAALASKVDLKAPEPKLDGKHTTPAPKEESVRERGALVSSFSASARNSDPALRFLLAREDADVPALKLGPDLNELDASKTEEQAPRRRLRPLEEEEEQEEDAETTAFMQNRQTRHVQAQESDRESERAVSEWRRLVLRVAPVNYDDLDRDLARTESSAYVDLEADVVADEDAES